MVAAPRAREAANKAGISINLLPSNVVEIGKTVSFEVTSARRGYILLVDADPQGKLTQVFPSIDLLERLKGGDELNQVAANGKLVIPSAEILKQGFSVLASEPKGSAAIVAIFSPRKVQLIDLPEPTEAADAAASVERLLKWIEDLRIADPGSGKLLTNEWSFNVKEYEVR